MAADDVELPELEVIQRYSLAVRGATAPRADVVAALQADLDWLTSGGGRPVKAPARTTKAAAPAQAPAKTPGRSPAKASSTAPAKAPAPPKRTARRAPGKRASRTPTSEA